MYFITTKRMLEVCFSAHPNIQYRTFLTIDGIRRPMWNIWTKIHNLLIFVKENLHLQGVNFIGNSLYL